MVSRGEKTVHPGQETAERDPTYDPYVLGRVISTLSRYRYVIKATLGVVALGYSIIALFLYLSMPTVQVTSQPFRLEFKGAERGEYPNGAKFSSADILSTPVLLTVYKENRLDRFTTFKRFSRSLVVIEANPALDELMGEYRAKLNDPKLTSVDRDKIEREYEQKRESLSHDEYSLEYVVTDKTAALPRRLIRKVLSDTLSTWATVAAKERGVAQLRLPILTKNILSRDVLQTGSFLVPLDILRTRIESVRRNIEELLRVSGSELIRTGPSQTSLTEIRLRVADLLRFRLQPLSVRIRESGATEDPAATLRFLRAQLRYNELQVQNGEARMATLQEVLQTYLENPQRGRAARPAVEPMPNTPSSIAPAETVMPQLSESFLDRILDLSRENDDLAFRQTLVEEIKKESIAVLPFRDEVRYYEQLLKEVGQPRTGASKAETESIRRELETIYNTLALTIDETNAIYQRISDNLNPAAIFYSTTRPPIFRFEKTINVSRLAIYGLLVVLLAFPLTVGGILLLERARSDQAATGELEAGQKEPESQAEASFTDRRRAEY